MGITRRYKCSNCGHEFEAVDDFDCGMSGHVVTPVVCAKHGIADAETGTMAWDDDGIMRSRGTFPCPECGTESPRWDRLSCPQCGGKTSVTGRFTVWD